MAEKKNIPEIRFKGFNDEWKECELGELLDITSASRVHKNEWTESGVPFFRSSDVVADYKGQENNKAYISYELYKELSDKTGCVQKNDVLVTGGGSIGIPYLIKTDEPLYFKDADLLWLKNENKINGNFLYTFFSTLGFRRYVNSITHIGTISHYTVVQAKSTPFKVPEKAEQDKIGEYLLNLDKLITLHQRKYDKLGTLKNAMLEKMFPKNGADVPEIRFKGFEGKWEEKSLNEIATMKARIGWQGLTQKEFLESGDYYLITGTDFENGSIDFQNCHYISEKRYNQDVNIQIKNGDVLITKDGTIGKVAYVKNMDKPTTLNAGVFVIRGKDVSISNLYLYHYLAAPFLLDYAYKQATGGTIKHLNQNVLIKFPVPLPNIYEQNKIGAYFQNLDNLISLHQKELEKLRNIKIACLEKMFV